MGMMMEVKNLTTYYKTRMNEKVCSVDNVSFTLEDGKSLGIAGESGCGKSTLAMSVMGYYFPPLYYESGSIAIDGKEITSLDPDTIRRTVLGSDIAYIPQAAMNALNPTRKIIRFIEDVLIAHGSELSKKDIYDLSRERFAILNLPEKVLNQYAVELSGGMKQRTIIAISTILNPKVLIADEPSSALDVSSQKIVIKLL
ncbi:MAG: ATP-binding cassette domain-containing protein, partial [Treponema sp.]|nr:ATP-binding cassette domain-containing protein [Treponema sp.]